MKAQFTAVYKANRHKLNAEERKEFVRELQKVIDRKGTRQAPPENGAEYDDKVWINEDRLHRCFMWANSPQGHYYWARVRDIVDF